MTTPRSGDKPAEEGAGSLTPARLDQLVGMAITELAHLQAEHQDTPHQKKKMPELVGAFLQALQIAGEKPEVKIGIQKKFCEALVAPYFSTSEAVKKFGSQVVTGKLSQTFGGKGNSITRVVASFDNLSQFLSGGKGGITIENDNHCDMVALTLYLVDYLIHPPALSNQIALTERQAQRVPFVPEENVILGKCTILRSRCCDRLKAYLESEAVRSRHQALFNEWSAYRETIEGEIQDVLHRCQDIVDGNTTQADLDQARETLALFIVKLHSTAKAAPSAVVHLTEGDNLVGVLPIRMVVEQLMARAKAEQARLASVQPKLPVALQGDETQADQAEPAHIQATTPQDRETQASELNQIGEEYQRAMTVLKEETIVPEEADKLPEMKDAEQYWAAAKIMTCRGLAKEHMKRMGDELKEVAQAVRSRAAVPADDGNLAEFDTLQAEVRTLERQADIIQSSFQGEPGKALAEEASELVKACQACFHEASHAKSMINMTQNRHAARHALINTITVQSLIYLEERRQQFRWRDRLIEFFFGWFLTSGRQKREHYVHTPLQKALSQYDEKGDEASFKSLLSVIEQGEKQFKGGHFASVLLHGFKLSLNRFYEEPLTSFDQGKTEAQQMVRDDLRKDECKLYRAALLSKSRHALFHRKQYREEAGALEKAAEDENAFSVYSDQHAKDRFVKLTGIFRK